MDLKKYAELAWTVDDVKILAPRLTDAQAEEFLVKNQKHLRDRLCELGWGVMTDLMVYDNVDMGGVGDDY